MLNLAKNYSYIIKPHIIGAGSNRLRDPFTSLWWEMIEMLLQPILPKLLKKDTIKILDYGGSTGHKSANIACSLAKLNIKTQIDYYDIDERAWNNAERLYNQLALEYTLLKSEDEFCQSCAGQPQYDVVILSEVYEHFPLDQCDILVRQIVDCIQPSGFLLLTTPNYYGQGPAEDSPEYYKRQQWGHYKHYTPEEVVSHLSSLGMTCRNITFSGKKDSSQHKFSQYWYPFYRLDERLYASPKLPNPLRQAYYVTSYPFWASLDVLLTPYLYGKFYSDYVYVDAHNSKTMFLCLEKNLVVAS